VFLGYSLGRGTQPSEATSQLIDAEVKLIVENCYEKARQILQENINHLHILAKGLLEYETLSGEEIKNLLNGQTIERPSGSVDAQYGKSTIPSSEEVTQESQSNPQETPSPQKE
jgi:cell division protease FtsH